MELPTFGPQDFHLPILLREAWYGSCTPINRARRAVGAERMMACYYYCSRKSLDDRFEPCLRGVVMYILETYQNNPNQPP